jgi:two-component system, chemotaxis family, sensor kinase CheA
LEKGIVTDQQVGSLTDKEVYQLLFSSSFSTADTISDISGHIMSAHQQKVFDFRGRVIPLISMKEKLQIPGEVDEESKTLSVVIVRKGEKLAALIVDTYTGKQDIVLRSLGNYLGSVKGIGGATILGDGQVALIVDCNYFF